MLPRQARDTAHPHAHGQGALVSGHAAQQHAVLRSSASRSPDSVVAITLSIVALPAAVFPQYDWNAKGVDLL